MTSAAVLALVGVLAVVPSGAAGQTPIADAVAVAVFPPPVQAAPAKPDRALDAATWTYVATAGADWALTAVCLEVSCDDKQSVGLFIYGVDEPKKAIGLGLLIDVGIVIVTRELVAPHYPTVARVILYGLSAARVTVTTLKIADLRKNATRSGQ